MSIARSARAAPASGVNHGAREDQSAFLRPLKSSDFVPTLCTSTRLISYTPRENAPRPLYDL